MSRPNLGMWLPLVGLAFAAFMFNTSEFMPVGLLTDIAGSFRLSEAQAGMMISIYAWAVMLLSLPLMMWGSRLPMRTLLLLVIGLFLAGQAASAVAPTFPLLVVARLLVAAAHAVFWSIASPLATRVADDRHAATAMSMVVTGSSVAMIFGMPLGRVIGLAVGWRMTFACVGAVALCVLLLMAAVMPRLEKGEPFTLAQMPTLLCNRSLMAIYAVTILAATGCYTGYSYVEPFLQQVAGLADGTITAALMAFGCAGIVGSLLFSRFYDGHRTSFSRVMLAGLALALLLMAVTGIAPMAAFGVCFIWGLSATAFNVAFQAEIIRVTPPDASAVAMSIFSGLFNLGIGCGTWLGGMVTDSIGIGQVGLVGGVIAVLAFIACCATMGKRAFPAARA